MSDIDKKSKYNTIKEDFDDKLEDNSEDIEIVEYLERKLDVLETSENRYHNRRKKKRPQNKISIKFIKEYIQKNKSRVLWSSLGTLVIILIAVMIINKPDSEKQDDAENKTISESKGGIETSDTEVVLQAEPTDSEYNKLSEIYYSNTIVEWNVDNLSACMENMINVDKSSFSGLNKYVEEVSDIVCYVIDETDEGYKAICVTYKIKFYNIETLAPAFDFMLFAKVDEKYKIKNISKGEEIMYKAKYENDSKLKKIQSDIQSQFEAAIESDEVLKEVYNVLGNISIGE